VGRVALGGLMAGVLAVLMVCAWQQTAYWQNSETLWTHALACTTGNSLAHYNLGQALEHKGGMDEAIAQYQKALEINPNYADAHNNLGTALFQKGRTDEAITHFQAALKIKPDFADAHYNLGVALQQKGRVDEAIAQYQEALQIKPDYAQAHDNLGSALLHTGRVDEAIAQYQTTLQISPDNADAHSNLGIALQQKGRVEEAIAHFQKALQIEPANPALQNNLAWILATFPEAALRNGNKAVELARQANVLTGGENPMILHTLAAALAEARRFPEAAETAQRALHLAEAQSNTMLAGTLRSEMKLYQAGMPFHGRAQTH
jgi:tetratricopeptide (TPR) repeat protein